MRRYFSKGYIHLWKCALATGGDIWDGDFLSGSQETERQRLLSARPANKIAAAPRVNVTFEEHFFGGGKSEAHIQLVFKREDGAWKIDDMIFLDNIAHNRKYKGTGYPIEDESFRESFRRYDCKR